MLFEFFGGDVEPHLQCSPLLGVFVMPGPYGPGWFEPGLWPFFSRVCELLGSAAHAFRLARMQPLQFISPLGGHVLFFADELEGAIGFSQDFGGHGEGVVASGAHGGAVGTDPFDDQIVIEFGYVKRSGL